MVAVQTDQHVDIIPQVSLRPHQHHRCLGVVSSDFRDPFLDNVLEGGGIHNTEANQEHIGVRVAERAENIEVFLRRKTEAQDQFVADT